MRSQLGKNESPKPRVVRDFYSLLTDEFAFRSIASAAFYHGALLIFDD
jgi:hypothetical protein